MPECYITHGWNKPTKTPIWLPRDVRNPGTLRSVLEKWFPLPKDKVTIIYEFINKDRRQADPEVSERFHKLSFELSDHEVAALIPSDDDSPLPESQSFSSYELHSSPPLLTTATNVEDRDAHYSLSSSVVISSSDSEFPSILRLIATTPITYTPGGVQTLESITLGPVADAVPSSPLSTIPDSPEMTPAPSSNPHGPTGVSQIPSRLAS